MLPVAGLDLSLRGTGICILTEGVSKPITTLFGYGLAKRATEEEKIVRMIRIAKAVVDEMTKYKIRHIGIEGYAFGKVYGGEYLGELVGVIKSQLYLVCEVSPMVIPTKTARKYLSGDGGMKKKQVKKYLSQKGILFGSDDEMDAFVIANYVWYMINGEEGSMCAEPTLWRRQT